MTTLNTKLNWIIGMTAMIIAASLYSYVSSLFPSTDQRNIRLEELFALTALSFLYIALLPTPLSKIVPNSPFIQQYLQLQPTFVYVTLFFAIIHASVAFFVLLGGFAGLAFLNQTFITGITLSISALTVLTLAALYNLIFKKLKWLPVILYLVGIVIVIHAVLLGADFIVLSGTIPKFTFAALLVLLVLEIIRFDKWLGSKVPRVPKLGIAFAILFAALTTFGFYFYTNSDVVPSGSIHAGHIMQSSGTTTASGRYTLSLSPVPANPKPGQDVTLTLKVFDAASGTQIKDFDFIYTKYMHLVILDSSLKYFNHIHPALTDGDFTITTQFPTDNVYRLYANYLPSGGIEQQVGLSLGVGAQTIVAPDPTPSALTKTFENMSITLSSDGNGFNANSMSNAQQILNFNFKDAATGQPIADMQPYLAAFGHLVMINEQNYNYVHVHPLPSDSSDFAGPDIKFMPAVLFEKITPGIYRVFGQFQRNGKVFVADFTINVN